MRTRKLALSTLAFAGVLCGNAGALTQINPAVPIKIVVPFPAGGPVDVMARLLADQIGTAQKATTIVENRPGAGAAIGTEAVARAQPDGHTLLIVAPSFTMTPHLRKLGWNPISSFEPICELVTTPIYIVVNSDSPYRSLADLLDAARMKPGELTIASVGPLTSPHLAAEMLKQKASVDMTYVPYPGSAAALNAVLGGHVTAAVTEHAIVMQQVSAGKLRALATLSRTRVEALPDVPTVAEIIHQDYEIDVWYGVVAPKNMPARTIEEITRWFTAALQAPETRSKLAAQGLYPVGTCGTKFGNYLREQFDEYGRVIRQSNMTPQ
jgi:tripartite-type tricarboxylate transporter receptor subunit TctC